MKINFTKNQFKTLIKTVYLGEWLFQSHKVDRDKEMHELEQYIYGQAKEFGQEELVDFDSQYNEFFPSRQLEELMDPNIEEYNDDTFWSTLTYSLAKAQMLRTYGTQKLESMTKEELMQTQQEFITKVSKEFEENGLKNLQILP